MAGRFGDNRATRNSPSVTSLFSQQQPPPLTDEDSGVLGGWVPCWEAAEQGFQLRLPQGALALRLGVAGWRLPQPHQRVWTPSGGHWGPLGTSGRRKARPDSDS